MEDTNLVDGWVLVELSNVLNATPVVTDDDARMEYMKTNLKAKADYVFFNASNYSESAEEPNEAEIKAYYNEHKDDYFQNEKRVLDYVLLELKPTAGDSSAIIQQANELLQDAKDGKDFAQLAELYSQDPGSAEKGGDLGFFGRGQMIGEFEEASFNAEPGDLVGPIETSFGMHLISVEEKRPAGTRGLDEVAEQIKSRLTTERAEEMAASQIEGLAQQIRDEKITDSEALEALAEAQTGVTFHSVSPFSLDGKSRPPRDSRQRLLRPQDGQWATSGHALHSRSRIRLRCQRSGSDRSPPRHFRFHRVGRP